MLTAIPVDEVDLDGKALEVRFRKESDRPDRLTVTVLAHAIEGSPGYIRRSELALVVINETMSRQAMQERVEAEAGRRGICRVAWIEEP
jgi:hypothetical protein